MTLPLVTLYTRPGCHLCEEAKALLQELAARYPHRLDERNIDEDSDLHARYHLTIPVVQIDDIAVEAPIRQVDLEAALRAVSQSI